MNKIVSVKSVKINGIKAVPVKVEVSVVPGIGIHLVGLADVTVKESLLRTVTALQANGYRIPGKKIIINLLPADLRKGGSAYDLPIAVGILAASGQVELPELDKYILAGEMGLDGTLRDVPGGVICADAVLEDPDAVGCILPSGCAVDAAAAHAGEVTVYGCGSLVEVLSILRGDIPDRSALDDAIDGFEENLPPVPEWDLIHGRATAKRALEIAAAGGHNIILIGSPESETGRLARALRDILPPLTTDEALDMARIYSAADRRTPCARPLRAPHYSTSMTALFGGGSGDNVLPGEVTLSHGGVLVLDELTNLPKSCTETLSGVMEDKHVRISRLRSVTEYPADFMLAATSRPCPCGYYGEGDRCTCTVSQRQAMLSRLSGPLYDRIGIQAWVKSPSDVEKDDPDQALEAVRERVLKARTLQEERFEGTLIRTNAGMTSRDIEKYVQLDDEAKEFIGNLMTKLSLSARSYSQILRIARTIADLDGSGRVTNAHLCEAACLRFLDRSFKETDQAI